MGRYHFSFTAFLLGAVIPTLLVGVVLDALGIGRNPGMEIQLVCGFLCWATLYQWLKQKGV